MLVAVAVPAVDTSIPLTSFVDPVIVVVPVPAEFAKPIVFPGTVKKLPLELMVIPA